MNLEAKYSQVITEFAFKWDLYIKRFYSLWVFEIQLEQKRATPTA